MTKTCSIFLDLLIEIRPGLGRPLWLRWKCLILRKQSGHTPRAFFSCADPMQDQSNLPGLRAFLLLLYNAGKGSRDCYCYNELGFMITLKLFGLDLKPDFLKSHMVLKQCCCLESPQDGKHSQIPQYQ